MSEVKILIEGYAKPTGGETFKASPSTVLIKDSGKLILVDPGTSKQKLTNSLKLEGVRLSDIDLIFLTHYHIDHLLNIKLFPDTDVCDGWTLYRDDEEMEISNKIPGTNVLIIPTPGHANEHVSLLVKTKTGKICVAGDLWWWQDGAEPKLDRKSLLSLKDPFAKDKKALLASRKKIFKLADYIIPGHGRIFKLAK